MDRSESKASVALRAWRMKREMTQMDAASLFGTAQTRYSEFECGTAKPGRKLAGTIEKLTDGHVQVLDWDEPVPAARKAG